MPPRDDDRGTPIVYADFTKGLFERGNDRECPSGGALELTDCMPLPYGGLRAAWAWREESVTGLPRNRRVVGFQTQRGHLLNHHRMRTGLMLGSTAEAFATSTWSYEYWFAQGGILGSTSTPTGNLEFGPIDRSQAWTSGPTHSSLSNLWPVRFMPAYNSSFDENWYYNIFSGGGAVTQAGLFKFSNLASSLSTQVSTWQPSYIAVHQDRIVMAVRGNLNNAGIHSLVFTAPSTDTTPPSSNQLGIGLYHQGMIGYLETFFPSDLLVLKTGHGGFSVQGDLGSGPLVRDLIIDHLPERITWGTRIGTDIAYMTERDGVWLWSGSQLRPLSKQIAGSPMTRPMLDPDVDQVQSGARTAWFHLGFLGQIGKGGRWLFFPKGYVYDYEMGCWFRSTLPGNNLVYPFWSYDETARRIYGAGYREPGDDVTIISVGLDERTSFDPEPFGQAGTMSRSGTFRATLPIIDTAERNVELRRIEVFGQGFGNGGTWQLTLSNDKGEEEVTDLGQVPARAASVRFNTRLQGDWLKVRLFATGNVDAGFETGRSEAPMIDRIILWVRPRQQRP